MLVVLLIAPSSASTGIEEGDKQVSGDTAWWHISLFGDDQLSNCYSILYGDGESADYGEQSNSGDILNINFTCSMDPVLDRDLILIEGDDIDARFKIELDGQWTNGQDDCNDDCENLNISLIKGDYTVAIKEFDNLDQGTNVIRWGIPIYDDLVYWNGSSDNIAIQFTMKIKPIEGGGFSADRDAVFGLYYSPTENDGPVYSDDDHTEIVFPVPCTNCGGGGLEDLPGFTWIISIGGLAMAAILIQNSSRMSESILKYEIIEYG
jgi:hypothetical protein